jgi:hypothetical protein
VKGRARNLVLVVVVLALWTTSASAEIVTIGLSAEITYITPHDEWLNEQFDIGDVITGVYRYDSSTPDSFPSNPRSGVYQYYTAPYGIYLSAGDFAFQTDPVNVDFFVGIYDRPDGDNYLLRSYSNLPLPNDLIVWHISWQLDDYSGTALSSDMLPTTPPVLEDWEYDSGLMIQLGDKGGLTLGAEVSSVELVPEPSTLLLLAFGGLAVLRRRMR